WGLPPMAVLVLLARAAPAGVVAAELLLGRLHDRALHLVLLRLQLGLGHLAHVLGVGSRRVPHGLRPWTGSSGADSWTLLIWAPWGWSTTTSMCMTYFTKSSSMAAIICENISKPSCCQ